MTLDPQAARELVEKFRRRARRFRTLAGAGQTRHLRVRQDHALRRARDWEQAADELEALFFPPEGEGAG